jgi:sugar/nucleoside kinase (ribokinase family)
MVGGQFEGERLGGGAANTAVGLASLGHKVTLLGSVGTDIQAERILARLARYRLDVEMIRHEEGPSSRALILLDCTAERAIVVLGGALLESADASVWEARYDALYIALPSGAFVPLMRRAAPAALVFATYPPPDASAWPAHIAVGSQRDLGAASHTDFHARVSGMSESWLRWLIVTSGEDGATAYAEDAIVRVPATKVRAIDTTGAGDALAAGVIHGMLSGKPMEDALRYGVAWGTATSLAQQSVPVSPPAPA